jgi:hypothetical protein
MITVATHSASDTPLSILEATRIVEGSAVRSEGEDEMSYSLYPVF